MTVTDEVLDSIPGWFDPTDTYLPPAVVPHARRAEAGPADVIKR